MIISINGKIIDQKKACIPVLSKSFLFGFSVFETMRTYNKRVFRVVDHIKRLYESANILDMKPLWSPKKVCKVIEELTEKSKYKESRIRVILTQKELIIMVEDLKEKPASFYGKGVKLASYPGRRSIPYAKVLGDAFCYLANQYAVMHNLFYDSILVDPDTSYVRECSYANIFWVNNGKLYTTDKNILYGITRDTVLELSKKCNFKDIKLKSLLKADEVFITQTTSGILPVASIDGNKIGDGQPGDMTKELMKRLNKFVWDK